MKNVWIRQASEDDHNDVKALNQAAFGGEDEAAIVDALQASGDSLYSLVAHNDRDVLGHIQFFKIAVDGADIAAGLGPMSVVPDMQNRGIGSGLVRLGLQLMQGSGRPLVFVLGHQDYYPRFGFSADIAAPFCAPWEGPAFMALKSQPDAPLDGRLTYPPAFGA